MKPGDIVVMASDGVHTCSDDELLGIVCASTGSAADIVQPILLAVEDHADDYQDNTTVIALRVHA